MAQLQSGFSDSTRASGAPLANSGNPDQAVNFRFLVTWTCLVVSADPPKMPTPVSAVAPRVVPPAPAPVPVEAPQPVVAPVSTALVATSKSSAALTVPKKNFGGSFQWEMVVPKMVRTAKKPRANRRSADADPIETPPPNLYTTASTFRKSFSLKLCVGVIAAAVIVVPVWRRAAHSGPSTVQTSIDGGDWWRQSAVGGDPGVKLARQLVLYRPALTAKDSRLEFAWTVASGDVGLVFRAKDLGNYYAVRLKLLKAGPTPTLSAEFFSVYQFVESPHTEKVLVFSKNDPVLLVRMDIFGPSFTLYLQDNATEFWTDARMTSGALGFFEEGNKSAEVRGLRMSFPERSQLLRGPLDEIRTLTSGLGGD